MSEGRPRILAICQEDPEHLLGGMGRHLRELYRAMAARGDAEVDLLVGGPAHESYEYEGFTKHHSDKLLCYKPRAANMASLLVSDIQLATTLMRLIAEGRRWDLVHVHEWNAMQVARMARTALGAPLVGTMHLCITRLMEEAGADMSAATEQDVYLMQQEGHLIVDVDELILCSAAYVEMARRTFMTDRPINLIYNGIRADLWARDPDAAASARARLGIVTDRPIALYAGRIAEMKGIRELLAAIEGWDDCPYLFVLAGEVNANSDEERDGWDVTRKIRELGESYPHRLLWAGFQDDRGLRGLYSAAEIGVMPSVHEPFGIVALEMMAASLPLVCTEVGGLGEIAADGGGREYALIIDAGDPRQIREAAAHLRAHPEAREELGRLGLERAGHFSWDRAAEQTAGLYRDTIRRHRE
jgi:glycosyltransferase involved in cell wall biosynthesis